MGLFDRKLTTFEQGVVEESGIQPIGKDSFHSSQFPRALGVTVEFSLPVDAEVVVPAEDFARVNTRGVVTYMSDWNMEERDGLKFISFIAWQRMPDDFDLSIYDKPELKNMATSFIDICWFAGIEAIDPDTKPQAATPVRVGVPYKDLGLYLPARYLDPFVDAVGRLSSFFLAGALEDAVCYGILTKSS